MTNEVRCIASFVEDGEEYWTEGCCYEIAGMDGEDYMIRHNFGGTSRIYAEDFGEYFEKVRKALCTANFEKDGLRWALGRRYDLADMDGGDYMLLHETGAKGRIAAAEFEAFFAMADTEVPPDVAIPAAVFAAGLEDVRTMLSAAIGKRDWSLAKAALASIDAGSKSDS